MHAGDLGKKLQQHLQQVVEEDLTQAEEIPGTDEDEKLAEKLLDDLHAEGQTVTVDPAVSRHWKRCHMPCMQ